MSKDFKLLLEIKQMLMQLKIARKEFLTLKEAVLYTGLSESKLYHMTSNREINFSKPEKKIYFKRKDLDSYMQRNEVLSNVNVKNDIGRYFKKGGENEE